MLCYTSTRKSTEKVSAAQAILKGISREGGLFVPVEIPKRSFELEDMMGWSYKEVAKNILTLFFGELGDESLERCIDRAYDDKFEHDQTVGYVDFGEECILELFHGPTLAFKDMALSILPYLMNASKEKCKETKETVILAATSGDTGKAALEGFAGVGGTKIIVFFPEDGVSDVQKRQMVTQVGENTLVIGIYGNFDDAQSGVKSILADEAFKDEIEEKGYAFSSANSINVGRLVPQIVYYFEVYKRMSQTGQIKCGESINVVVPTGNFGNILAAYYAKSMGLPIQKLICASNKNKVLFDFFESGKYDAKREFYVTNSPSMDILVSSNLERLLYHLSEEDTELVDSLMNSLKTSGKYEVPETIRENLKDFWAGYCSEERTKEVIRKIYESKGYLMDTHTAVAYAVYEDYKKETKDELKSVIVSTASPYKFSNSVMSSIDPTYEKMSEKELLYKMEEMLEGEIPKGIRNLFEQPILHQKTCNPDEMKRIVAEFLG